jgi:hypothetical protein
MLSHLDVVLFCCCAQVTMFADVVEVIRNPVLQAQFLQLPFAAMLALLRSEQVSHAQLSVALITSMLWVWSLHCC